MAILDVRDVTKRFGAVTAVDGVSFRVAPGEVVGLLGPNGAGKTTTLHMVLGLVTPDAGEVRLFGEPLGANRSALLGRMNFAAGYVHLPGQLTVEENLRVFARLYGVRDVPGRVAALLDQLELDELRRRQVRLLSSGQQTRVQLAKALVNGPELLVLDEPTASLDPDVGDRVRSRRRLGCQVAWLLPGMAVCGSVDGQQRSGRVDSLGGWLRHTRPAAATRSVPLVNQLCWATVWHAGAKAPPELTRPCPPAASAPVTPPQPWRPPNQSMFTTTLTSSSANDVQTATENGGT
jgi:ABC-2 type transport system ATP-binding protein